jgi:DNA-directed RNA polymerase subunit L
MEKKKEKRKKKKKEKERKKERKKKKKKHHIENKRKKKKMPTKTYTFNEDIGPLLQDILLRNPDVKSAGYLNDPTSIVKKTTIVLSTEKLDPDSVFEDTITAVLDKIQKLHNRTIIV